MVMKKGLWEVKFPNYENFDNVNDAYSNFIKRLIEVIAKVASVKSKEFLKNYFDSDISEKLIIRDKLFKKYRKARFHVDKRTYIYKSMVG